MFLHICVLDLSRLFSTARDAPVPCLLHVQDARLQPDNAMVTVQGDGLVLCVYIVVFLFRLSQKSILQSQLIR